MPAVAAQASDRSGVDVDRRQRCRLRRACRLFDDGKRHRFRADRRPCRHEIRFPPSVSRVYLGQLDKRYKAVKDALRDGFGVDPQRVVQNAYEPLQFDEKGQLCGAQPTLGMDVQPKLRMSRERIGEVAEFFRDLTKRIECTASVSRHPDCPAGLATGGGTGFHLVTEHIAKFAKRGVCARNPSSAMMDGLNMGMPRLSHATDEFKPYSPAAALPYAAHWRLSAPRTTAFLTANTHREGISPFDILQPTYAGSVRRRDASDRGRACRSLPIR